ncbi:Chitin synthase, class 5 [Serendipita sp. 399]|nr:Chitin synthase, class 5 [Serendipita sp. 399]
MATVLTQDKGSFTFTVGKLDAGMAILIGTRAHLIEFPSILLPDGVTVGSIVDIDVRRNVAEEEQQKAAFWRLQNDIYMMYGINTPSPPVLKLRNVTQTSVTLEWPPLELATASLRSLEIYKNGARLATIPNALGNTSTKVSSLQMASLYTFQLILRTTAGTYPSNVIEVWTHKLEDTSGISVCFGTILDSDVGDGGSAAGRKEELKRAIEAMGAKYSDKIQIDTTHFVCTTSLSLATATRDGGGGMEEPGVEYQKAVQLSIPIVQPDWVLACYYGKKMVPTAPYYLGVSVPPLLQGHTRVQSISQQVRPAPPTSPPSTTSVSTPAKRPAGTTSGSRSSSGTVPHGRSTSPPAAKGYTPQTSFVHEANRASTPSSASPTIPTRTSLSSSTTVKPIEPPPPSLPGVGGDNYDSEEESPTTPSGKNRQRTGTMNKAFKFPPDAPSPGGGKNGNLRISPPPPLPPVPPIIVVHAAQDSVSQPPVTTAKGAGGTRVMPEPPSPDVANAPGAGGVGLANRRDSDADAGEIVEVDLS